MIYILDTDPNNPISLETALTVCQPDEQEILVVVKCQVDLETLAAHSGLFKSKAAARRIGLQGPIPWGFNLWGMQNANFWVWNPYPNPEPPKVLKKRDLTNTFHHFIDDMKWWNQPISSTQQVVMLLES